MIETSLTELDLVMPKRGDTSPETTVHVELESYPNPKKDQRPVIFLLPGGPGSDHRSYKKTTSQLAQKFQLLYFDPRGCGKSSKAHPESHTTENYVDDLEEIRQQLFHKFGNQFEKITLLGGSYGGMAALAFTLKYQTHINKLILIATAYCHQYKVTAGENVRKLGTKEQVQAYHKVFDREVTSTNELLQYLNVLAPLYSKKAPPKPKSDDPKAQTFKFKPEDFGWDFFKNEAKGFSKTFDFTDELHTIKCPTLILAGERDWVCDKRYSKEMAKLIPSSKLIIYEHANHTVLDDVTDDCMRDIINFMEGA